MWRHPNPGLAMIKAEINIQKDAIDSQKTQGSKAWTGLYIEITVNRVLHHTQKSICILSYVSLSILKHSLDASNEEKKEISFFCLVTAMTKC